MVTIEMSIMAPRGQFVSTNLPHGAIWATPNYPTGQFGLPQITPRGNLVYTPDYPQNFSPNYPISPHITPLH